MLSKYGPVCYEYLRPGEMGRNIIEKMGDLVGAKAKALL